MRGASGPSENQTVSCGQSSGVERAAAKVVKGKKLAILRQLCGNFGQPTPDRGLRFCAKPADLPQAVILDGALDWAGICQAHAERRYGLPPVTGMHSARALAKPEQLPLFLIALMRLTLLGFHRGFSNYLLFLYGAYRPP
jgi:hypothetical protein